MPYNHPEDTSPYVRPRPRRSFCTCGHSWYSHDFPRPLAEPISMRCERIGCRCAKYTARPEPHVSEEANHG